ncbi:MAG: hypothetical protein ACKV1O_10335 [Saprospiraceae bacterium]
MEKFILTLKDNSKRQFLLELLTQLDFVELKTVLPKKEQRTEEYDFFKSAGLFAGRDVDADQLRKQAWRLNN